MVFILSYQVITSRPLDGQDGCDQSTRFGWGAVAEPLATYHALIRCCDQAEEQLIFHTSHLAPVQ